MVMEGKQLDLNGHLQQLSIFVRNKHRRIFLYFLRLALVILLVVQLTGNKEQLLVDNLKQVRVQHDNIFVSITHRQLKSS